MDRAILERHLLQAEEHVALGREHIRRQMEIVSKLEREGRDITTARQLLTTFEDMQEAHEADRNRILKELGED